MPHALSLTNIKRPFLLAPWEKPMYNASSFASSPPDNWLHRHCRLFTLSSCHCPLKLQSISITVPFPKSTNRSSSGNGTCQHISYTPIKHQQEMQRVFIQRCHGLMDKYVYINCARIHSKIAVNYKANEPHKIYLSQHYLAVVKVKGRDSEHIKAQKQPPKKNHNIHAWTLWKQEQ